MTNPVRECPKCELLLWIRTPLLQYRGKEINEIYLFIRFPLFFLMINRMLETCPLLPDDRLTLRNQSLYVPPVRRRCRRNMVDAINMPFAPASRTDFPTVALVAPLESTPLEAGLGVA